MKNREKQSDSVCERKYVQERKRESDIEKREQESLRECGGVREKDRGRKRARYNERGRERERARQRKFPVAGYWLLVPSYLLLVRNCLCCTDEGLRSSWMPVARR